MKVTLGLAVMILAVCSLAHGQYFAVSGNCELPGQAAVVSGLPQSGTQPLSGSPFTTGSGTMASYPGCVVTVYPAGSGTPVPTGNVFSDVGGDPLGNPFTANTDGSWVFYVVQGCYDVGLSSGTSPASLMPASKTLSGKCAGGGGGGGGSGTVTNCATAGLFAWYSATGTVVLCNPNLLDNGTDIVAGEAVAAPGALFTPYVGLTQGPDQSASIPANTIYDEAPTSVTSYTITRSGTGPSTQAISLYSALASAKTVQSWFQVTVSGTGITFPGYVATNSDGVHPGALFLVGNTTAPVLTGYTSNYTGFIGPPSASFTSYFLQLPSTAPSGTQYLGCGTPSSNISTCTWGSSSSSGVTGSGTTGYVPVWASSSSLGNSDLQYTLNTTGNPNSYLSGSDITSIADFNSGTGSGSNTGLTIQSLDTSTTTTGGGTNIALDVVAAVATGASPGPATQGSIYGEQVVINSLLNTGTTSNSYGIYVLQGSGSNGVSTGTITNRYGYWDWSKLIAGTVTNDYGFYEVSPQITGGTMTHHYGFYMADQTTSAGGSNGDPHGFYEVGNAPNAFQGHLNQIAAGNWAGTCTMTTTTCTITLTTAYSGTPGCVVTVQGGTAIAGACSVSGTTVTITAASSNTATWAAILFGNPN